MELVELIQTLGFPIACVVACAFFIYKNNQQSREDNIRREDRAYQNQKELTATLDKATDTIDRINMRLDVIESKIDNLA